MENPYVRSALDRCRDAVDTLAPPEYDRLVTDLAASLDGDQWSQQMFIERAQALRHTLMNRYLDEEVQNLQWQLNNVYRSLAELDGLAERPRGLSERADAAPWPRVSWEEGDLPPAIQRCLNNLGRFVYGVERELDDAARVQRMLLPRHDEITTEAAHLAGFYRPAHGCGGDFWTAERLPDKRLLVVVGDVTGHGSAAAIITGAARVACDGLLTSGAEITCEGLLAHLNRTVRRIVGGKVLMTAVVTIIDPERGEMVTANAGNPLPYVLSRDQNASALRQIIAHGTPLGASEDSVYESVTSPLASGDLVLWYTDGVTDCRDVGGNELGERELRALLRASTARSARHLRDEIVERIGHYSADAVLADDITLVSGLIMPMQCL